MDLEIEKRLRSFLSDVLNSQYNKESSDNDSDNMPDDFEPIGAEGGVTNESADNSDSVDDEQTAESINEAIKSVPSESVNAIPSESINAVPSEEPITILDSDLKESAYYDYTVTHKSMDLEKLFDGLVTEYMKGGKDMDAMLSEINQKMTGGGTDENIVDGGTIDVEPVVEQNSNPDYKIDENTEEPTKDVKYDTEIEIIDLAEYNSMLEERNAKNKLVGGKIKPSLAKYTELYPFVINY